MRWVEELAPEHRWLARIAMDPACGTYLAGRGVYRLDGQTWTLLPGTDERAWRGLSVDPGGLWVTGASGAAARIEQGKLIDRRIPVSYDVLEVRGDATTAFATAAGSELWTWTAAGWSKSEPPEFSDSRLGSLFLAPQGELFVRVHPRATGKASSVGRRVGDRWLVDSPFPRGSIQTIGGTSASDIWAIGGASTLLGERAFAYHWDGRSWTATDVQLNRSLYSIYARAPDDVWVGGDGGALLHWDGRSWSQVPTGLKWGITAILAPAGQPFRVIENAARVLRWEDL